MNLISEATHCKVMTEQMIKGLSAMMLGDDMKQLLIDVSGLLLKMAYEIEALKGG